MSVTDRDGGALAAAARRLAGAGLAVIPLHGVRDGKCTCRRRSCPSPAKHPRVFWVRFELEAPTLAQVESWWQRWPDANVGVITGGVSGVVVLDVDPRNGGASTLASLVARWGRLPPTVATATGGGGAHFWFAHPGTPLRTGPLAPGVDLEAEGGIVVAPPSVHASGERYSWRRGASPERQSLAELPEWLVTMAEGGDDDTLSRPLADPPPRTDSERTAFAEAWARAGITLAPGDRYYRCPFHDDRHPSLHVDAEGCRWYCFGCRRGGGVGRLRRLLGDPPGHVERAVVTTRPGDADHDEPVTLPGDVTVEVVGEAAHQDALLALTGGERRYGGADVGVVADLSRAAEDRARVDVRIEGELVGRLDGGDSERYGPLVDDVRARRGQATCRGRIRGGWDRGGNDVGAFGVILSLPEPAVGGLPLDVDRRGGPGLQPP